MIPPLEVSSVDTREIPVLADHSLAKVVLKSTMGAPGARPLKIYHYLLPAQTWFI